MNDPVLRRLLGGVLLVAMTSGCGTRSPFADTLDDDPRTRLEAANAPTPTSMPPTTEAGDDAVDDLPALEADATLDDYRRYAALNNAGLQAAFQDWKAAVERLPQVRALPDPHFTYGYYLNEVETRVGPMQHLLSLSQTFPWFGKLQDREDAAGRHANAAYQRFEAARLDLFFRVERAYNELFFLEQSIGVTTDNIELLRQFERVALTRYRVAAAGHPALLKIQVELGTLEDRRRQLRDLRAPYVARLNAALNRPPGAAVPPIGPVSERVSDAAADQLIATLQQRNPELIALQEEIERERIGSELARKDGLPDLTVGLAYTVIGSRNDVDVSENGDDAVLATFSVNLPLWRDKYDAAVREANARRLAAAGRRSEAVNQLASAMQEALFEHHDARRRVELYRDTLLPKAIESLQAALGAFEQGQSDFLDLVDAQRTLLEFQLALERALVDRATSYARLERLVGVSLADIESMRTEEEKP